MNIVKRCRYGLMVVNLKDIWQGRSFEVYGEYSESEVQVFRQIVAPGDTVIEVGANIGSHTIPLARLVGTAGLVVAFEPERTAFYTLCGNVSINNLRNVFCFQQACGDLPGVIRVPELDYERTVNFGGTELDKDYSQVAHYPVPLTTVDAMNSNRCNLLKVDVEGMEEKVLRGAEQTIKKLKPALYVENDRAEHRESLRQYISSLGYTMFVHNAPFFNPENFFGEKENVFDPNLVSMNLLCLPPEKAALGSSLGLQSVEQ